MIKFIWNKADYETIKDEIKDGNAVEIDGQIELSLDLDGKEHIKLLKLANYLKSRLSLMTPSGWSIIPAYSITFIESFGDEIYIHSEDSRPLLVKHTLYELEAMLKDYEVIRVGKSFLVNLLKIRHIQTTLHAKLELILSDGSIVEVSRSYVKRFKDALGI